MRQNLFKTIILAAVIATSMQILRDDFVFAVQNQNLELGIKFLESKDYNQALRYLKDAAEDEPKDAKVHYNLALTFKNLGMVDEALAEFELAYKVTFPETEKKDTVQKSEVIAVDSSKDISTEKKTPLVEVAYKEESKPALKPILDDDYIDMAEMYFTNQEYNSAAEYYNYSIAQNPDNDYALYKLSRCYIELNNLPEAKQKIELALKISPDNKEYQALQAELFTPTDQGAQSQQQNQIYNYDSEYYNQKGLEFFKNDEIVNAEKYFLKAVELDALCAKAFNNLGNIEFQRQNYDKSIEYYLKAVKADPEYTEAYYNLSMIYKKKNDTAKVLEYIDKAIASNSSFYQGYYLRATESYKLGNIEKAKADLKRVIELKSDHISALINLGTINANLGNLAEATDYFSRALKIDEKNAEIYYQFALISQVQGKFTDSVLYLEKAAALSPNDYRIYLNLGRNLLKNKDYDNAKNALAKASELNPKNPDIYNYLSLAYSGLKQHGSAIELITKALNLNPNRPIYHYNLSQCYLALDDNVRSVTEFQLALRNTPVTYTDYMDMAEIYADKGMADYATDILRDGIKKYPDNEYFYLTLSKIYEKSGKIVESKEVLQSLSRISPHAILKFKIKEKIEI